jgi:hypothetical protein
MIASGVAQAMESQLLLDHQRSKLQPAVTNFLTSYKQVADKTERTLLAFVRNKRTDDTEGSSSSFSPERLEVLIQTVPPSWEGTMPFKQIAASSFVTGKAKIMVKLLQEYKQAELAEPPSESDVNSLFRLCQDLVFSTLPQCYQVAVHETMHGSVPTVLTSAVTAISEILLACEQLAPSLAPFTEPGRTRLHQWLVSWLQPTTSSSPLHPMSQQIAMDIVQLHIMALDKANSDACNSLVGLLVKLLFSDRIRTSFRVAISSVLSRMAGTPDESLKERLASLIFSGPEVAQLERSLRHAPGSKKRPRSDTEPLCLENLRRVHSVMSKLVCKKQLYDPRKLPSCQQMLQSSNAAAYGCFCVTAATCNLRAGRVNKDEWFAFIDSFLEAWSPSATLKPSSRMVALAEQLLVYVRCCCGGNLDDADCSRICKLIAQLCSHPSLINILIYLPVVLETIRTIDAIARHIHQHTSTATMDCIARTFFQLLSNERGIIRSQALSTLLSFLEVIPHAHKSMVLQAIPKSMYPLLKARKGNDFSSLVGMSDIHRAHVECVQRLSSISCQPRFESQIFPEIKSFCIPMGSYIVTMKTASGVHARVIFPPDPELVGELADMCDSPVWQIQKVESVEDGNLRMYVKR